MRELERLLGRISDEDLADSIRRVLERKGILPKRAQTPRWDPVEGVVEHLLTGTLHIQLRDEGDYYWTSLCGTYIGSWSKDKFDGTSKTVSWSELRNNPKLCKRCVKTLCRRED